MSLRSRVIVAYYHVAGMNHWREIVSEQLRLLGNARFPGPIHVHYAGDPHEQWFIWRVAESHGLTIRFLANQALSRGEAPILECVEVCAHQSDPDTAILYFHTKGASHPGNWERVLWRWMMNKHILVDWEQSLGTLTREACDWVGTHIRTVPMPYSVGNFWIARASYIRRLPNFFQFRNAFLPRYQAMLPHGFEKRHADEMWIGSNPEGHGHQLLNTYPNLDMWSHSSWCQCPDAQLYATQHGS